VTLLVFLGEDQEVELSLDSLDIAQFLVAAVAAVVVQTQVGLVGLVVEGKEAQSRVVEALRALLVRHTLWVVGVAQQRREHLPVPEILLEVAEAVLEVLTHLPDVLEPLVVAAMSLFTHGRIENGQNY
jgi:HJR/Mrr/RecB family endonuclease